MDNHQFKSKSVVVTGAAGFIGSHIVEYLLEHGAEKVRVLDNLSNGKMENVEIFRSHQNYEFIEGDITDFDTCLKACEGMDYVCHQAAVGSVPRSIANPMATTHSNVDGFVNMAFAAKQCGIKRFVYASSSSVYGDEKTLPKLESKVGAPMSPYAVSKKTNELFAEVFANVYDMEFIGLRYFNVFGPRQDPYGQYAAVIPLFIKALVNNETVFIDGDGGQTRDFTYVLNAVQANIKALLTDNVKALNQVYNVAVGANFSVNYMFDFIRDSLKKDLLPTHREARAGDIRDSLADISKANNLLDYKPEFSFEKGLPITIEYFKKVFEKEAVTS
ncbi:MAG: SDR family oxidoreductase [Bacteroidetes bacterium]|nr:SDR family oxidoreductase [Bacteroidota bacterium]